MHLKCASLVAQLVKKRRRTPAMQETTFNVGNVGSIPGSGGSPGGGNGNPLQYSCLGNPTDRGAWQATVHGVTIKQLNHHHQNGYMYYRLCSAINS